MLAPVEFGYDVVLTDMSAERLEEAASRYDVTTSTMRRSGRDGVSRLVAETCARVGSWPPRLVGLDD